MDAMTEFDTIFFIGESRQLGWPVENSWETIIY